MKGLLALGMKLAEEGECSYFVQELASNPANMAGIAEVASKRYGIVVDVPKLSNVQPSGYYKMVQNRDGSFSYDETCPVSAEVVRSAAYIAKMGYPVTNDYPTGGLRKVDAIKYIRTMTGFGLKEAKDFYEQVVEAFCR